MEGPAPHAAVPPLQQRSARAGVGGRISGGSGHPGRAVSLAFSHGGFVVPRTSGLACCNTRRKTGPSCVVTSPEILRHDFGVRKLMTVIGAIGLALLVAAVTVAAGWWMAVLEKRTINLPLGALLFLVLAIVFAITPKTFTTSRFGSIFMSVMTLYYMIVAYSILYMDLSTRNPDAFTEPLSATGAIYFTLVTLTTTGYGDIAPRSDLARGVVSSQLMLTVTVVALALGNIARILERRSPSQPE